MNMNIFTMTQKQIIQMWVEGGAQRLDGGCYIEGIEPILFVAHVDTVYDKTPTSTDIVEAGDKVYTKRGSGVGIGGDDRAGCAVLWKLWNALSDKPFPGFLLCEDEETGGKGSAKLAKAIDLSKYKAVIELDAPGYGQYWTSANSNTALNTWCASLGLTKNTALFNDIANLCIPGNPPGVTIGTGYYNFHQEDKEWVSKIGMQTALAICLLMMSAHKTLEWTVMPEPTVTKTYGRGYGNAYNPWNEKDNIFGSQYISPKPIKPVKDKTTEVKYIPKKWLYEDIEKNKEKTPNEIKKLLLKTLDNFSMTETEVIDTFEGRERRITECIPKKIAKKIIKSVNESLYGNTIESEFYCESMRLRIEAAKTKEITSEKALYYDYDEIIEKVVFRGQTMYMQKYNLLQDIEKCRETSLTIYPIERNEVRVTIEDAWERSKTIKEFQKNVLDELMMLAYEEEMRFNEYDGLEEYGTYEETETTQELAITNGREREIREIIS